MTAPIADLPRAPWSKPIRRPDRTTITIAPVVRHNNPHDATSRYADIFWLPILGGDALALIRWASHQTRPITLTETQLATALGAHGIGQIRKAIETVHNKKLATINGTTIHVDITLPNLTHIQAERFGPVFAQRHRHALQDV